MGTAALLASVAAAAYFMITGVKPSKKKEQEPGNVEAQPAADRAGNPQPELIAK
jgi:hypothetical protein